MSWGNAREASYDAGMLVGELSPGTLFAGDYRIVRPLSSGGMGAVYVAEQLSTSKERALKLMRPELVAKPDLRKRFEQEAKVSAKIASDHVVEIVGAGVDEATGAPWLAMELLAGEDLFTRLERVGSMDPDTVRVVFEQLCHGLAAAHARKIVHRDLKPENVFLTEPRRPGVPFTVKILDFGIAKTIADAESSMTAAVGTPSWMAPEQTDQGGSVTPATDVWPLGLLAFLMLTGKLFWKSEYDDAKSTTMLLREMLLDPVPDASVRAAEYGRPWLPQGFDGWFRRCVVRDPRERFSEAGQAYVAFAALFGINVVLETPAPSLVPSVPKTPATIAFAPTAYGSGPLPESFREHLTGPPAPPSGFPADVRAQSAGTGAPVSTHVVPAVSPRKRSSTWAVVALVLGVLLLCGGTVGGFLVFRATKVKGEAVHRPARLRRIVVPASLRGQGDATVPAACPCGASDRACLRAHPKVCPRPE